MVIEKLVYALLSNDAPLVALVGDRINPQQPPTNEALPHLTYTCTSTPNPSSNDGVCELEVATLTLDVWCLNSNPLYDVLDAAKALLHGYRGGQFQFVRLDTHSTDKQERGYHGQHVYSLWWTDANVVPTATSDLGKITTGSNHVTLEACDHTLTLDCDGLSLDGAEVGGAPDLSSYARKDQFNTFTAGQTINPNNFNAGSVSLQIISNQAAMNAVEVYKEQGNSLSQSAVISTDGAVTLNNSLTIESNENGYSKITAKDVNEEFGGDAKMHFNAEEGFRIELGGSDAVVVQAGGLVQANNFEGSGTSLTGVAKTGSSNTFTQPQTITIPNSQNTVHPVLTVKRTGDNMTVASITERYDPSGNSGYVRLTFHNNKNGGVSGSIGFTDGFNGFAFDVPIVALNGVNIPAGGISVGSYADSQFSGRLTSYANKDLVLQAQAGYQTQAVASNAASVPLVAKGAASQTADLLQCQNSAGTKLFGVGAGGQIKTNQSEVIDELGGIIRRLPVYDFSGNMLGYIPLHDTA